MFKNIKQYNMKQKIFLAILVTAYSILVIILLYIRFDDLDKDITSDEYYWLERSDVYINSLLNGNFKNTLYVKKGDKFGEFAVQGAVTRLIAGTTIHLYNIDSNELLTYQTLKITRTSIGLFILLLLFITLFFLHKVFKSTLTVFIFLMLYLSDTTILAYTKILHLDVILSLLIILSMLLLILGFKESKKLYFLLSGIFMGAAVVQKAPALILLPYFFILIILNLYFEFKNQYKINNSKKIVGKVTLKKELKLFKPKLYNYIKISIIWITAGIVSAVLIYPSLIMQPILTVKFYLVGTLLSVIPNDISNFYTYMSLGKYEELPFIIVLFFYVYVIFMKGSIGVISVLLFSIVNYFKKYTRLNYNFAIKYIVLFVLLFILQMTSGNVLTSRYILPAYIGLIIIVSHILCLLLEKYFTTKKYIILSIIFFITLIQTTNTLYFKSNYTQYINLLIPFKDEVLDYSWGAYIDEMVYYVQNNLEPGTIIYLPRKQLFDFNGPKDNKLIYYSIENHDCLNPLPNYIILEYPPFYNLHLLTFITENNYSPEFEINKKGIEYYKLFKTDEKLNNFLLQTCY